MSTQPKTPPANSFRDSWKDDLLASVVVFLVALPLCMGVAIASGAPPDRAAAVGIITGIIGGLIVGPLGGSPLQVSGPAAGLVVMVGQMVAEHGFATLGLIIMVAGVAQILAGLLRFGQWFRAVSPAVIQGMLAGIGMLIFAGQFHVMVDDTAPGAGKAYGGIINLMNIPQAIGKGLSEDAHQAAAGVGALTIVAIVLWVFFAPKKLKVLPPPLVGVLLATAAASLFQLNVQYINVPDSLFQAISLPQSATWSLLLNPSILGAGLAMAFVASAESLLTASAADSLQQRTARTNYDRELAAQGAGNLLCGFFGALPLTGVIVRTSANIEAGARTPASTMMHAVWLLIFAGLFPFILRLVPVASLAAILVYTGWKLMNPKAVRALRKFGQGEVLIYGATMGTVVVIDLLTGILVGIGLAVAQLVYRFTHLKIRYEENPQAGNSVLFMEGAATFLRLPQLADALALVPDGTELHIHFEELRYIDHACLNLFTEWEKQHEATGGKLVIDWHRVGSPFRALGEREGSQATS